MFNLMPKENATIGLLCVCSERNKLSLNNVGYFSEFRLSDEIRKKEMTEKLFSNEKDRY